jgi:polyisoprenyl-phosphate glycosyltransferase
MTTSLIGTERKCVSIVVPFFNEENIVPPLKERLCGVLRDLNFEFELVLVDDGSTDRTFELLVDWQKEDSRVVVVKLSRNWGHQNAFNAGLDTATGDAVIFMDGDLEDPPEIIPELINGWLDGYEIVYTVKAARKQTLIRRILTSLYYAAVRASNTQGTPRQAGMFSLVDQKVANVLRIMKESSKSYPNLRSYVGMKSKAVTYSRGTRDFGAPRQTYRKLIADGLNGIFSNTYLPIRIITIISLLFSTIFLLISAIVVFVRLTGIEFLIFHNRPGTQLIILSVLTIGTIQMVFLGIIGEYIARIYEENKARPYYVVDTIVGETNRQSNR